MSEPLHVILNPACQHGAASRLTPRVEKWLESRSLSYRLLRTEGPGHAAELAQAAMEAGVERLLVVGGDGTIHEVANGLLGVEGRLPAVAVVPLGTGNDFYRMVGVSSKLEDALDALDSGEERSFEVGLARWQGGSRYFVNLFGVGIDAEVLRRRAGFARLPGQLQYLASLVTAVVGFRPPQMRITLAEGEVIEEPTMLATVTVGPSIGGGFMVAPAADPLDGLLDLCFVRALSYLQIARIVPRVIRGTHGSLDTVRLRPVERARFEAAEGQAFPFQLDGELFNEEVPWIEVEVRAASLRVLVPGKGATS